MLLDDYTKKDLVGIVRNYKIITHDQVVYPLVRRIFGLLLTPDRH